MIKVGAIVYAQLSDSGPDPILCRVLEVVDQGREIIRAETVNDPDPDSKVHGVVVKEAPEFAWRHLEALLDETGASPDLRKRILQAAIAWSDVECRNIWRETVARVQKNCDR
jgi:hypothetical protein